jgi:PAS domain S-box-containing protein
MKNHKINKNFEYLQTIFNTSADGLMICDGQGHILKLNKSAERLNGIKADEVIGRSVQSLIDDGSIDRSATQEVIETGRSVSVVQTTDKSGYTLLVTGTPVFDNNNKLSFVVINERDISLIENMRIKLHHAMQESEKIKEELLELNLLELKNNNIVAHSESMKQTLRLSLKLSKINASNILIQGESGTGKGLLSKFIHKNSLRSKKPFIQINCAALPENLLEAELFGYAKGAFTGANEKGKLGLFEIASEGTILLDEIGEISLKVQAKLLKCLEDHEIFPIGGTNPRKINCSIITATNKDLEKQTNKKKFRLDLFHRLNTFTLKIPPLRERPEDILELVRIYLEEYNKQFKRKTHIGHAAFQMLKSHYFPGNVRELINIVKQAVVMCDKNFLDEYIINSLNSNSIKISTQHDHLTSSFTEQIESVEKDILIRAANRCNTTREVASFLSISQPTVVRKFKKHGIKIHLAS